MPWKVLAAILMFNSMAHGSDRDFTWHIDALKGVSCNTHGEKTGDLHAHASVGEVERLGGSWCINTGG